MMRTSWAYSIAAENDNDASSTAWLTRAVDVPPHLRSRQPSSEPYPGTAAQAAPPPANDRPAYGGPLGGSRWGGGARPDFGGCGVGTVVEVGMAVVVEEAFAEQENSGINFDAYGDIPVETSGDNVATPVNIFINGKAKKFAYQTGVSVVVVYGGAPITQQVSVSVSSLT
ncbi:hypothetical protein Cgig2_031832 [Carnegiea gigantea]|uniref:Uncharacterized protein n=1 Tax=Carnegiea gigantea TaxID=171969 RepID=A0A9Q1QMG9_9CARY|nr:hypothetical protein Cgig2_031832 [Carnegiea gigantea]